jgi:hypothetical protein
MVMALGVLVVDQPHSAVVKYVSSPRWNFMTTRIMLLPDAVVMSCGRAGGGWDGYQGAK